MAVKKPIAVKLYERGGAFVKALSVPAPKLPNVAAPDVIMYDGRHYTPTGQVTDDAHTYTEALVYAATASDALAS